MHAFSSRKSTNAHEFSSRKCTKEKTTLADFSRRMIICKNVYRYLKILGDSVTESRSQAHKKFWSNSFKKLSKSAKIFVQLIMKDCRSIFVKCKPVQTFDIVLRFFGYVLNSCKLFMAPMNEA